MPKLIYGSESYWLPEDFTAETLQSVLSRASQMRDFAAFTTASGSRVLVHLGSGPLAVVLEEDEGDEDSEDSSDGKVVFV
jgi:hypothetical protein